jgi:hypothetical protein
MFLMKEKAGYAFKSFERETPIRSADFEIIVYTVSTDKTAGARRSDKAGKDKTPAYAHEDL